MIFPIYADRDRVGMNALRKLRKDYDAACELYKSGVDNYSSAITNWSESESNKIKEYFKDYLPSRGEIKFTLEDASSGWNRTKSESKYLRLNIHYEYTPTENFHNDKMQWDIYATINPSGDFSTSLLGWDGIHNYSSANEANILIECANLINVFITTNWIDVLDFALSTKPNWDDYVAIDEPSNKFNSQYKDLRDKLEYKIVNENIGNRTWIKGAWCWYSILSKYGEEYKVVILHSLDIDDVVKDLGLGILLKLLHPDNGIFDLQYLTLSSFTLDLEDPDILTYEEFVELIISTWNRYQCDIYPDADDADYRTIISIEDFE